MVVVTGKAGSGKSTLLKNSKLENVHYLDDVVKNILYKRNSKLYWEIKKHFGKKVVSLFKVKTKKLGKIVFNDSKKMAILNDIVEPYIKTYLNILKLDKDKLHIVEMAAYINLESKYKSFFDKVIIIKRNNNDISNKFNYLKNKVNPIINKDIEGAIIIKNDLLDVSTKKLIDAILTK
ncbi:MAG: dephospho-CoA kinase [Mycoplasmatales bacterium]|nr:dephospho-CoA kinase [Mycoplasmatales bacterium]